MNDEDNGFIFTNKLLGLKICILLTVCLVYIIVVAKLYFRRKSQIIINRSPYIMIMSIFFSFALFQSNILIFLLPESNKIPTDHSNNNNKFNQHITDNPSNEAIPMNFFQCSFFNFNSNFTFFFILLCYVLRAKRLNKIYRNILERKVSRTKERFYIKFLAITVLLTAIIYSLIHSSDSLSDSVNIGYSSCNDHNINSFKKESIIFQLTFSIIKIITIIYGVYLIYDINDEFHVSKEIIIVSVLFFIIEMIKIFFKIFYYSTFADKVIFLSIFQATICLVFSGIIVLKYSYEIGKIPICYTIESSKNFNLMLYNKKALESFLKFLQLEHNEGAKLLLLYLKIYIINEIISKSNLSKTKTGRKKIYNFDWEKICSSQMDNLFETSLNENSFYYVSIPENIKEFLSYDSLDGQIKLIKELLYWSYSRLKDSYFMLFEKSREKEILEDELIKEEIIFNRICQGSELDYNLTDYEFH